MRRTPLTDLFAARNKLNTFKLNPAQLTSKLGNLKLNSPELGSLGRRGKTLAYGGTALALAGIGGVTAAAATSAAPTPVGIAGTSHHLSAGDAAGVHFGLRVSVRPAAASASAAPSSTTVASAEQPGAVQAAVGSGHAKAAAGSGHARAAGVQASGGSGHAHAARAKSPHVVRHGSSRSWKQIRDALASQTSPRPEPGKLPLADRLLTGPASGAQSYLPIGSSQMANATAIVHQALAKHMGLRAAVIAVATAMQESGLQNINYGDRDSLGLFQQRPSMGWGTASQITTPSYAADAFLSALAAHQKADPGWAGEPLWATAQAVQKSGFPYAYAKWEKQAAQLVTTIATKLG